ncbi:hypothetical protein [Micromonospora sp. DH14]|nr:hypothetical protein [Micromonospora sp. DH14]MDG9675541.1 hypothetical protein [Micromonospora sp. DH14]
MWNTRLKLLALFSTTSGSPVRALTSSVTPADVTVTVDGYRM